MAKKVKRAAPEELNRKQRSRLEKERRMQRLLIYSLGAVAILIVGVLGYGVVAERIIRPRQPVAVVDGDPITTAEFQARVKFSRLQLQNQLLYLYQQQQLIALENPEANDEALDEYFRGQIDDLETQLAPENADLIGHQVLNQMIQEELVQREAERRGIEVTPDEVQDAIHAGFGYDPELAAAPAGSTPVTPTESLTPSEPVPAQMTADDFRDAYSRYMREGLRPLGISEQQYRSWIEAALVSEQLREAMKQELPREAEQVRLRFLVVSGEERANELVERLDAGEGFDVLAEEIQADELDPGYSDELDWMPRDRLESLIGEELTDRAFSLEAGGHSEPIALGEEDQAYYYIISMSGREVRELEESVREEMAAEAFRSWLDAQQTLVERKSIEARVPTQP